MLKFSSWLLRALRTEWKLSFHIRDVSRDEHCLPARSPFLDDDENEQNRNFAYSRTATAEYRARVETQVRSPSGHNFTDRKERV
jgi:hypothetical protein